MVSVMLCVTDGIMDVTGTMLDSGKLEMGLVTLLGVMLKTY